MYKPRTYNDGRVIICKAKDNKTSFNAKINPKSLDDLEIIVNLAFEEKSKRQEDIQWAEQQGVTLSMKILVPNAPGITSAAFALIDMTLYSIRRTDPSRREVYLYLEEVDKIAGTDQGSA